MRLKIFIASIFIILCLGILLIFSHPKEDLKADWINELNYKEDQVHNISFGIFNPCPTIPVKINDKKVNLGFDTGNGMGISLTTAVDRKIDYEVTGKVTDLNADGTYRGEGDSILLNKIDVFGEEYSKVKSSLSDWKMYGVLKLNGTIGLAFFQNKVITLDYRNNKIAITSKPIDYDKLQEGKYIVLPLIKSSGNNQSDLLYFEGYVNGEKSTIYLDTGSSRSFVDLGDRNNKRSNNSAIVKIGNKGYKFNNLKNDEIKSSGDFEYPLKLAINSDILKSNHFIITIDNIEGKLIIHQ